MNFNYSHSFLILLNLFAEKVSKPVQFYCLQFYPLLLHYFHPQLTTHAKGHIPFFFALVTILI